MRQAERDDYTVFDWAPDEMDIGGLLRAYPALVLGRHAANLSFDSGPLKVSEEEEKKGWTKVGALAISPRLADVRDLPYTGFDEWMVFDEIGHFGAPEAFVNFYDFSPIDYPWGEKKEAFWSQLRRLRPRSVIADGSRCYLVTRDSSVIEKLKEPNQTVEPTPPSRGGSP